jgi:tetratricopeptide (TPR) repeat protein
MKRSLIPIALLFLAACADSPSELFAKANAAYSAHDYTAAKLHLAAALDEDPTSRKLLLLQARTMIALGDGNGAGTALEKLAGNSIPQGELAELSAEAALLRKAPELAAKLLGDMTSPEAERLRALAAIQKEEFSAAGSHFAKSVEMGGNARAFADYSRYKLMAGDLPGAIAMVERAQKVAPDALDTLLVRGQIAVRQGDLKLALENYSRASQHYSTNLAALSGQAAVLGDLGRIKEMSAIIARIEGLAPNDPTVIYLSARASMARKKWADARSMIESFKGNLAKEDPSRLLYGEALLRLNLNEQAIAQLGPIARFQPGNREAVRLFAEAQIAVGDAKKAAETLRPLADNPAARKEDLSLMVKAAKIAADPQLAKYEARLRQPPVESLGADIAEADVAMRKGNWAGAVSAYERILSVSDGRNVMLLNNMAYAQLMLGNYGKANDFARRALKLAPHDAAVLDTAGWARFKSGMDVTEAKRLLRLAAEKAPRNLTIQAHLAEAERAPG